LRPRRVLLTAIFAAALIARLWGIAAYEYNGDELQFVIIARGQRLREVWRRGLAELHPPLANFLHHYLLMITADVFVQRLLTVALGLTAIAGIYRFASLLKNANLGLVCAGCMAIAPVAVSTSIVFRNYALFMALLSFALCFFVRLQRQGKPADLAGYAALVLLACATHFSGFIVAAACGLQLGGSLLYRRKGRAFLIFSLAHLPVMALAVLLYVFYVGPGAIGPAWKNLFLATGFIPKSLGEVAERLSLGMLAYGMPLRHFVSPVWRMGRGAQVFMLASALLALLLQIAGLREMYRQSKEVCVLVLSVWGVAILLALANTYSFDDTRHNYYLLPFFILPFAYLLEPMAGAVTASMRRAIAVSLGLLLTATAPAAGGCYLNYDSEFVLTRRQFADGRNFLDTHLQPGDVIVTGRIDAYFYLLYAKDYGVTPYDAYTDQPYLRDTTILAPYNAPSLPYTDHQFRDSLLSDAARRRSSAPAKYWFVAYGWQNTEILNLLQCDALNGRIGDFYSTDGALIFSVSTPVLWNLLRDEKAWKKYDATYTPVIYALPLKKVSLPK